MRDHANELAEGNYASVTGVERSDEVGELARAIDFLTEKLNENERVRSELDRMRMDFFANVSHELRTPITVVRAYTETLVDNVVTDPKEINNYYGRILTETKSMERLVGDLLILSKLQNPDFKIEKEPINICQIFTEIQRSLRLILEKAGLTLSVKSDSDSAMIIGDYDRVRQMFLIVINNAIKFSECGSDISVTIENAEWVKVVVSDRGIGMSEDEINSVFEKFYSSKLSRESGGSGLGLSIAKHIADRHGCELTVESVQGQGSTFTFKFKPVTVEEEDVIEEEMG
jgi:signal transduction histidine kinase